MSRLAKYPIDLPHSVRVVISLVESTVTIQGPLGSLSLALPNLVSVQENNSQLFCRPNLEIPKAAAFCGTVSVLLANMVIGVTKGFEKKLLLVGVGYRAQAQGNKLNMTLGFSHPIMYGAPEGIKIETPTQTEVLIRGADKQMVGQVADDIRRYRPPGRYKGEGVRYIDEIILLKETKKKK